MSKIKRFDSHLPLSVPPAVLAQEAAAAATPEASSCLHCQPGSDDDGPCRTSSNRRATVSAAGRARVRRSLNLAALILHWQCPRALGRACCKPDCAAAMRRAAIQVAGRSKCLQVTRLPFKLDSAGRPGLAAGTAATGHDSDPQLSPWPAAAKPDHRETSSHSQNPGCGSCGHSMGGLPSQHVLRQ
jgi:hypothetical protein